MRNLPCTSFLPLLYYVRLKKACWANLAGNKNYARFWTDPRVLPQTKWQSGIGTKETEDSLENKTTSELQNARR